MDFIYIKAYRPVNALHCDSQHSSIHTHNHTLVAVASATCHLTGILYLLHGHLDMQTWGAGDSSQQPSEATKTERQYLETAQQFLCICKCWAWFLSESWGACYEGNHGNKIWVRSKEVVFNLLRRLCSFTAHTHTYRHTREGLGSEGRESGILISERRSCITDKHCLPFSYRCSLLGSSHLSARLLVTPPRSLHSHSDWFALAVHPMTSFYLAIHVVESSAT